MVGSGREYAVVLIVGLLLLGAAVSDETFPVKDLVDAVIERIERKERKADV